MTPFKSDWRDLIKTRVASLRSVPAFDEFRQVICASALVVEAPLMWQFALGRATCFLPLRRRRLAEPQDVERPIGAIGA